MLLVFYCTFLNRGESVIVASGINVFIFGVLPSLFQNPIIHLLFHFSVYELTIAEDFLHAFAYFLYLCLCFCSFVFADLCSLCVYLCDFVVM